MARSFLRGGGTWGKLFSAVDGFFILSPTAHFSQRQFPFFLRRVTFCCCWQKVCRRRQKTLCEKETRRRHKKENDDGNSEPVGDKNKNHPPEAKSPQKNRRVILTRLFLTSSLS